MSQIYLPVDVLFDRVPDPVFLLQDQIIVYQNQAGALLFPGAAPGAPAPEPLQGLPQEGAAAFSWQGRDYCAVTCRWERQVLVQLRLEESHSILPNRRVPLLVQKLRGLLAAIASSGERLESLLPAGQQAEANEAAGRGIKAQMRLLRLARSLELAALAPTEPPYDFHPCLLDLQGLCHDVWRLLSGLAGELGCTVIYQPKPGNYLVCCDDALLRLQIYHLASNAFRAMGPGGTLTLRLEKKSRQAHIVLEDNGPGLSQKALASLFDPTQGGDTLEDLSRGVGLGLGIPVCRKIASLHQGAVLFSNRRGGGLQAVISLPLKRPEDCSSLQSPPTIAGEAGASLVLRELSDLLPARCFRPEDL